MTYQVTVTRPLMQKSLSKESSETSSSVDDEENSALYSRHFDSDGMVHALWAEPAAELDLPLITKMWQSGLRIEKQSELEALACEVDKIERYWKENPPVSHDPKPNIVTHALMEHFQQRMAYLREAISIAQQHQAVLTIR